MGETRLRLGVAYLLVSEPARLTIPAAGHKGHGHPVPRLEARDTAADGFDLTGELVAGNMWHLMDVRVAALPTVPIAPANTRRPHPQDRLPGTRHGIGELANGYGPAERVVCSRSHTATLHMWRRGGAGLRSSLRQSRR